MPQNNLSKSAVPPPLPGPLGGDGFYYVATPYRAFPGGLDAAAEAAELFAAELVDAGVEAYSPIAHTHRFARHVKSAGPRSDFWLVRQMPFLRAAAGIIVATHLAGWDKSSGVKFEIDFTRDAGKPVLDRQLDPLDNWDLTG